MGDSARGGMSYTVQCVKSPDGASGSCTISARARVPRGTVPMVNDGLRPTPSQVSSLGKRPPGLKSELVMPTRAGGGGGDGLPPPDPHPASATAATATHVRGRLPI